jgi:hypothetical protein
VKKSSIFIRNAIAGNYWLTAIFLLQLFYCKGNETENGVLLSMLLPDSIPGKEAFDTGLYKKTVTQLANYDKTGRWPASSAIPLKGAIVPYNRVIAFYGNFYSVPWEY